MLRFLVGLAAVAVTISSGLSIFDHYESYSARVRTGREIAEARATADAALVDLNRMAAEARAREARVAEGLRVCDLPYAEYRRGLAADSVTKPRMEELKRIITDCNAKYGTDFSL